MYEFDADITIKSFAIHRVVILRDSHHLVNRLLCKLCLVRARLIVRIVLLFLSRNLRLRRVALCDVIILINNIWRVLNIRSVYWLLFATSTVVTADSAWITEPAERVQAEPSLNDFND